MSRNRLVLLFALVGAPSALAWLSQGGRLGHSVAGESLTSAVAPAAAESDELYHWSRLPVRVFIAADDGQDRGWAGLASAGFDEWVHASHDVVRYRLVDSPSLAQITVRFVPAPVVPGHPDLVGLTTTFWIGPVLQSAEIVLATGQKSPSDLQTAAAHEFGHALGIRGHSDDPNDLMFAAPIRDRTPLAHPVTARDLNTLKRCYPELFAS